MPEYTIQVFGADVGGIDQDFEADTFEEARTVAEQEHENGARPTVVYDSGWNPVYYVER